MRSRQVNAAGRRLEALPPQIEGARKSGGRSIWLRLLIYAACLVSASWLYVGYQHFKVSGQSTVATASLVAAALLALAPVRALVSELWGIEGKALHMLHGLGGLALIALPASGLVSGTPMLTHAAMAPFALMGAAQALMHSNSPRNAQQAAAIKNFAASLPEVAQFTKGNLSSPANIARAIAVLTDLIGKAQALGETELQSDPGFQSGLKEATARFGLTLSLDSINHAVNALVASQADPAQVRALQRKMAEARETVSKNDNRAPSANPQSRE
jgi:hypothetical protein